MSKNSLAGLNSVDNSKNSLPTGPKIVRPGRKPKPESEKAKKPITLKFTQAEFDKISEKAGLISKATFLKQILFDETDLLK